MYKNILLPTDGSPLAARAIDAGIALAKTTGAQLTALVAIEPFHLFAFAPEQLGYNQASYSSHARAEATKVLDAVAAKAAAAGLRCDIVLREADHPHEAITDVADSTGCDLIVMASHGRRGVSALVLGSVTMKVLAHSKTPVLVYR